MATIKVNPKLFLKYSKSIGKKADDYSNISNNVADIHCTLKAYESGRGQLNYAVESMKSLSAALTNESSNINKAAETFVENDEKNAQHIKK